MVETINPENYVKGTEQKNGVLFNKLTQVNFLPLDNIAVCYVVMGEYVNVFNPETEEEELVAMPLITRSIKYTEAELKTLIEATGRNFNADGTNLLMAEINAYADDIILEDITNNPQMYYGLEVAKWHKV